MKRTSGQKVELVNDCHASEALAGALDSSAVCSRTPLASNRNIWDRDYREVLCNTGPHTIRSVDQPILFMVVKRHTQTAL